MTVNDSLDLDQIDSIGPEEVDAALMRLWAHRGPLYGMYSMSLQLDYAPDFAKLTRWASDLYRSGGPEYAVVVQSCQNIHSYMMLGWETGLRNEFETLWRYGMSRQQLMELVMFSQMHAGMRGLDHVYHAVGDFLPMMAPRSARARPGPAGLTQELIIRGVTNTAMYFTGTEGMYAAYEVVEPIFDDWGEGG